MDKIQETFKKDLEKRLDSKSILYRIKGTTDKGMGLSVFAMAERLNKKVAKK